MLLALNLPGQWGCAILNLCSLRYRLLCFLLSLAVLAPVALAATSAVKIKNGQVLVTEEALNPGETLSFTGPHPSVVVYLTAGGAAVSAAGAAAAGTAVQRGQTIFVPAQHESLKNTGSAALKLVRVILLGPGSAEVWGKTGLPPNYKILVENRYVRAYDIHIAAHAKEPRHTHHARVVVTLSGAILEHSLPDGQVQPATLKTGQIAWRPAQTHVGHNLGTTNLWVIAIEPK